MEFTPTSEPTTFNKAPIVTTPTTSVAPTSSATILPKTIWQILKSRQKDFSILIDVAEAVGFDTALQEPGELTLFAPNNDGEYIIVYLRVQIKLRSNILQLPTRIDSRCICKT